MAQGLYQHVRDTWRRPKDALPHMYRQQRMAQWRREPVNCRIERPTVSTPPAGWATKPSKASFSSEPVFDVVAFARAKST